MTLQVGYGDDQLALAASVRGYCERHVDEHTIREPVGEMPTEWWAGLAELGVLGLGTDEGGGGPVEIAAACEELGRAALPGPFSATFVATHLLEADERDGLVSGKAIAAVGSAPLLPWAPVADLVIEIGEGQAWLAKLTGDIDFVETTAGEPWGRVTIERSRSLGDPIAALAVGDVALAAYLVGAGRALLNIAATYAADRHQFNKPIGDFQAVAHPLADVDLGLRAASQLVPAAARALEAAAARVGPAEAATAATARLSATRAALAAAYQAHQTLGAIGFTIEGPVAPLSQRVRQVTLHLPGPERLRDAVLARPDLDDRTPSSKGGAQ